MKLRINSKAILLTGFFFTFPAYCQNSPAARISEINISHSASDDLLVLQRPRYLEQFDSVAYLDKKGLCEWVCTHKPENGGSYCDCDGPPMLKRSVQTAHL